MTMTASDMVFVFCSNVVFIPWLALMIAPKWKWTKPMVKAIVVVLCVVYTISFGAHVLKSEEGALAMYMEMGTLSGLAKLFSAEGILLPAWVHYLAFDLLVAYYMVVNNEEKNGLSKLAMAPCLFFNMMCGPVGVLLYVVIRRVSGRINPPVADKRS